VDLRRVPFPLLLLALLIALLLPTTVHGDFRISSFNSTLIFTDRLNFYRALADEPTAVFPTGLSGGPYGPLFYYPTAAWIWSLDKLHIIHARAWAGTNDPAIGSLPAILALKLPNLAAYLAAGAVIARTLRGERGQFAAELWLANPAVILFTLMMGQNDGWTALASVAALHFGLRAIGADDKRPSAQLRLAAFAMLCLAAGAAVKLSPILLVPVFAWLLGRSHRDRLLLALVGGGAFLLLVAPFLSTKYFWDYGLFGRQAGKTSDLPSWANALLYAAYLGAVLFAARRLDKTRALIWAFVAFHALFFLLGGWSPQRSVLFIAALAIVVPLRRWFALPYVLVTAFALLTALEHRADISTGLFQPLTVHALLIPPLIASARPQPGHGLLFAASTITWLGALALALWPSGAESRRVSFAPYLLIAGLPAFLLIAATKLPTGVDAEPYPEAAQAQALRAGDELSFYFISPQDELRSITFFVDSGGGRGTVEVRDANGTTLASDRPRELLTGANRIDIPRARHSKGEGYTVSIAPEVSVSIRMAGVPPQLALASAELNGRPLADTVLFSVHYETTWSALAHVSFDRLRDSWRTMLVSVVICGIAFAGYAAFERRLSD